MTKVATKQELLQSLSAQLRRDGLDDLTYIKLLKFYAQLSGWEGFQ